MQANDSGYSVRSYIPNVVLRNALSDSKMLNIVHINIKSLFPKIDMLRLYLSKTSVQVAMVSETWLTPEISDKMVHIPGYKIYRHDRNKTKPNGKDMRGVAVYIKCGLAVKVISTSKDSDDI